MNFLCLISSVVLVNLQINYPTVARLMGWWLLARCGCKPLFLPIPIINWRYLKNITSKRNAKVARPSPIPKMKKGPIKSFSRMGAFLEVVSDFDLAKHFGARGNSFFIQNGGSPVSQSSIKLSYRTSSVFVIKIRHYKKTTILITTPVYNGNMHRITHTSLIKAL